MKAMIPDEVLIGLIQAGKEGGVTNPSRLWKETICEAVRTPPPSGAPFKRSEYVVALKSIFHRFVRLWHALPAIPLAPAVGPPLPPGSRFILIDE